MPLCCQALARELLADHEALLSTYDREAAASGQPGLQGARRPALAARAAAAAAAAGAAALPLPTEGMVEAGQALVGSCRVLRAVAKQGCYLEVDAGDVVADVLRALKVESWRAKANALLHSEERCVGGGRGRGWGWGFGGSGTGAHGTGERWLLSVHKW